jgi:DNA/RNA endonuclease G (NUC1)
LVPFGSYNWNDGLGRSTMCFTNMAPQDLWTNNNSWEKLEGAIKTMSATYNRPDGTKGLDIQVFTGMLQPHQQHMCDIRYHPST